MSAKFTEERALWLYHHYRWLECHLPAREAVARGTLVLPTQQFFPDRYAKDHGSADILFHRVKDLMGMSEWPCRLEQRRDGETELRADLARSGVIGDSSSNGAAGTFSVSHNREVVITYSASSLPDPHSLVATFAHELCHYLLAQVTTAPPGTWKELEPLTDLSAVVEGFGLFLCNTAFQFQQFTNYDTQGWGTSRKGYLTEAELGFAFAISCVRNRLDVATAARALKPNPREVFIDALDYIADLEDEELDRQKGLRDDS